MGLGRFWIKHGPGSPGSTAKAITKDFLKWKKEYPSASKNELLEYTLISRMKTHEMIGKKFITSKQKNEILQKIEGKLFRLIVYIDYFENPDSQKSYLEFPDLYNTAKSVMKEVMIKYAPGME